MPMSYCQKNNTSNAIHHIAVATKSDIALVEQKRAFCQEHPATKPASYKLNIVEPQIAARVCIYIATL
jgi:hypothetical protein